jgi:hypothetical protein
MRIEPGKGLQNMMWMRISKRNIYILQLRLRILQITAYAYTPLEPRYFLASSPQSLKNSLKIYIFYKIDPKNVFFSNQNL